MRWAPFGVVGQSTIECKKPEHISLESRHSRESKALIFWRIWSFNVHALYMLSVDDLGDP